jgi:F0F1-type ATP synthase membrane subunit b/b'
LTTFLFEAANFLLLAGVLGWLFFKPVRQALAEHRKKFESDNLQAAEKLAEAEKLQQEMAAARGNLQAELNEQRTRDLEAARLQAEQILTQARSAADRQLQQSHRQAARMSETQQDRLAEVAAAAAAESVGRLLEQIDGPELQSALVQSACRQLQSFSPDAIAPVKIESSQPLSPGDMALINDTLGPARDSTVFSTVDRLGVGVRISTAQGLIDASSSGLAHFARQTLVKELQRRANNHNPMQRVNNV